MSPRPVMLVGSGASLAAPANLALFGQIQSQLLEAIGDTLDGLGASSDRALTRLRTVAPEVAFQSLMSAGVDVPTALVEAFDVARAQPNAVHEVVAHHLASGGLAWTTNYDTLIERAWRAETGRAGEPPGISKPHGTFLDDPDDSHWVGAKDLVFAEPQVLPPWNDEQTRAFVSGCAQAGALVAIGYSGVDVNARDAVRQALRAVDSVIWYEKSPRPEDAVRRHTEMALRFPELDQDQVRWSDNPGAAFVADHCDPSWTIHSSKTCPVTGSQVDIDRLSRAVKDARVVAVLAGAVGEVDVERQLVSMLASHEVATTDAVARWANGRRRRQRARMIVRPMWNAVKPVVARVPNPLRGKARSTWVATHPLRSPDRAIAINQRLERWLEQVKDPEERAALQLDRSRALRVAGHHVEAVEAARDALQIAVHEIHDSTVAGRAEMETVEALRVLGRFDEALDAAAGRYDTLGLIHWQGWNSYELGCAFIQLRRFEEATVFVEKAADFFSGSIQGETTAYDRSLGNGYSLLAHTALRRLTGDHEGAEQLIEHVARTDYREGREQIEVARRFQAAEVARATGRLDEAVQGYRNLPEGWENYPTLASLGLAYAIPQQAEEHLSKAAHASSAQESLFGLALCRQAAHDLGSADPVGQDHRSEDLRGRIFADEDRDPTRAIAFL